MQTHLHTRLAWPEDFLFVLLEEGEFQAQLAPQWLVAHSEKFIIM
jgi:hypothetical protein